MRRAMQNCMIEISFISKKAYKDPFNEIELSVVITDPQSNTVTVPAFWAGGQIWCIRYASSVTGIHKTKSICSDKSNLELHDKEGTIEIVNYSGENPLFRQKNSRCLLIIEYLEHRFVYQNLNHTFY